VNLNSTLALASFVMLLCLEVDKKASQALKALGCLGLS